MFIIKAELATNPPMARLPVSPINTLAGYTLNKKNAISPPVTASALASMPKPLSPDITAIVTAIGIVTHVHNPSSPSVKLDPLTVPNITKKTNKTKSGTPSSTVLPPVNGIRVFVPKPECSII